MARSALQFAEAVDACRQINEIDKLGDRDRDPFEITEELERMILNHRPESNDEAKDIVDLVVMNLEAGPRSDGLDIRGLRNVSEWLRHGH